ncbi:allantoinase AllB [Natrarchaeobius sp. A-rgal3]|uniref:allantoinase AllB n=1 Tax=Natrarchaeobius versutus TaxID=1679078 RepID=UPI00350F2F95
MSVDLVVRDCTIVTPEGQVGPNAGVAVDDGKIVAVGSSENLPDADEVVEADGNYLAPGVIDCHIHNRTPGLEYKEDWKTATRAAAAGGVTTVMGMPNTDPVIDQPEHIRTKADLGDENALVDFQFYAVITSDNYDQVHDLAETGVVGYKVFLGTTIGAIPPPNDGELLEAMEQVAETNRRLGFHEENDEILSHLAEKFQEEGKDDPIYHTWSRPPITEREAISRTILFAEETGAKIHMFHLSCGSGAELVADGKDRGVDVTAETMPHYLWFTEDVMREKGNVARIQPPIRDQEEQDRLWEQVHGDGIDCIATDHSPHTDEEKGMDDPFKNTWEVISGFVGLETEVPAMLSFVNEDRMSLEQWIDMHSTQPAKIWGMYPEKGSLQVGTDADFTIFDLENEWTLEDRHSLHSKNTVTPFEGETFSASVETTIVRGNVVYEDGEVVGESGYGTQVDVDEIDNDYGN